MFFYKYEGAAFEDGKGPSIWDNFTHHFPGSLSQVYFVFCVCYVNMYNGEIKSKEFEINI